MRKNDYNVVSGERGKENDTIDFSGDMHRQDRAGSGQFLFIKRKKTVDKLYSHNKTFNV